MIIDKPMYVIASYSLVSDNPSKRNCSSFSASDEVECYTDENPRKIYVTILRQRR